MPIFADHNRDEGHNRQNSSTEAKGIVQKLIPHPHVLVVAVQNDLRHSEHRPTDPHQPPVQTHDSLLCVESGAVTSATIKLDVEEAIVLVVVGQGSIEIVRVNHLDIRVQGDIIVGSVSCDRERP